MRHSNLNPAKATIYNDMSNQEPKFPWDFDMPDHPFWQAVGCKPAKMFHTCFSVAEISQIELDPKLDQNARLALLLEEHQKKLSKREAEVSPKTLVETDFDQWIMLKMGIASTHREMSDQEKGNTTHKEMMDTPDPRGKPKLSTMHMTASLALEQGQYTEAEKLALELLPLKEAWPTLGAHSPQALNMLRMLIRSRFSKFQKYEADEREQNAELVRVLGVDEWSV